MLAIVHHTLALNQHLHEPTRIQTLGHQTLIDDPTHRQIIIPGLQRKVLNGTVADDAGDGGGELQGDVAHGQRHYGWVGDICKAAEIWLTICGSEVKFYVGYIEAD